MKQAAVTPAQACSSSVTVAAASQSTGPVTETTTAATTATRRAPTAPTRVSVPSFSMFPKPQKHLAPQQFHYDQTSGAAAFSLWNCLKWNLISLPEYVWFQIPLPGGGEYFRNADLSALKYCFLCRTIRGLLLHTYSQTSKAVSKRLQSSEALSVPLWENS